MESEKVKEIKKALGNCQKDNCIDCPYFIDEKSCRANDLLLDTITLINELESENERIKNIGLNEDITVREWLQENQQLKDRIAELEKEKTCEYIEHRDNEWTYWECSSCEEPFYFSNDASPEENQYHYCPNCGAKITAYKEIEEEIDETLKEFIK